MRFTFLFAMPIAFVASAAVAQISAAQLAKPPADAEQFTIMSSAGKHGSIAYWTAADGSLMGRSTAIRPRISATCVTPAS
jgi:hypothetical protein